MRSFIFYYNIAYHLLVFLPLKIIINFFREIQKKVFSDGFHQNDKIIEYRIISKSQIRFYYSRTDDFVYVTKRHIPDREAEDVLIKDENISLFSVNQSEAVFVRSTKASIFMILIFLHFSFTANTSLQKISFLCHCKSLKI